MIKVKLKPYKPDHDHCKRCGKDMPFGRNKFCGDECRKSWRSEYVSKWQTGKTKEDKYRYKKKWEAENKDKVLEYKRKWAEKQKNKIEGIDKT